MSDYIKVVDLGDLIGGLYSLPESAVVTGVGGTTVHSYRGVYREAALEPDPSAALSAWSLAGALDDQIGSYMEGWKGGDFYVSEVEYIHLASEGDIGQRIIGLKPLTGAVTPDQYTFDLEED